MTKLHRCPECGAIWWRESIRDCLRWLFSAKFRRQWAEIQARREAWETLIWKAPLSPQAGDKIEVPYIERVHDETP